jgi:hypothetical protein
MTVGNATRILYAGDRKAATRNESPTGARAILNQYQRASRPLCGNRERRDVALYCQVASAKGSGVRTADLLQRNKRSIRRTVSHADDASCRARETLRAPRRAGWPRTVWRRRQRVHGQAAAMRRSTASSLRRGSSAVADRVARDRQSRPHVQRALFAQEARQENNGGNYHRERPRQDADQKNGQAKALSIHEELFKRSHPRCTSEHVEKSTKRAKRCNMPVNHLLPAPFGIFR